MRLSRERRSPAASPAKRVQPKPAKRARGDAPATALHAAPVQRRCACGGGCPRCADKKREGLQPRLEIGAPDDAFEQEAERVAERVVAAAAGALPDPPAAPPHDPPPASPPPPPPATSDATPPPPANDDPRAPAGAASRATNATPRSANANADVRLRVNRSPVRSVRRCACGGSCSRCKDDARRRLQREGGGDPAHYRGVPEQALLPTALGPGHPLEARTRAFVEAQFGTDFAPVRIHHDGAAARAAAAIDAQAYTYGQDIVFGAGRYAPHTRQGLHLLAHELTHVVQQGGAGARGNCAAPAAPQRRVQRQDIPGFERPVSAPDSGEPCPPTPTNLGLQAPQPACPRASHIGTNEVRRWRFCLDSNQIAPGQTLRDLANTIGDHHRNTRYLVHGHASTDGDAGYNLALACHRANTVGAALRTALADKLRRTGNRSAEDADLRERMEVATRGETAEFGPDPADNRLVVLYAEIPGSTTPEEPDCADAPRHLGDVQTEVPCDRASVELRGRSSSAQLQHFQFCQDSDVFNDRGSSRIASFAAHQASAATYVVHGFASQEGDSAYNQRLSCHRAQRVARELLNAGVRPDQLREVAGNGETTAFSSGEAGMEGLDRVAVVLAEQGAVSELRDPDRPADTDAQKQRIIDVARARLTAGQYEAAADIYISRWTCGRTATVRQAVQRLQVSLPQNDKNEQFRDQANGQEESGDLGVNGVRLSNTALRADNPIECVMGRLVDMAFHHAVLRDPDLPSDLTDARPGKIDPNDKAAPPSDRHLAGLHLIHLAGLGACEGDRQRMATSAAFGPIGIDAPLERDPRTGLPLPRCASAPQPTRSSGAIAGDDGLQRADFLTVDATPPHFFNFVGFDGRLSAATGNPQGTEKNQRPMTFNSGAIMGASSTLQTLGDPAHFADYEVGFMQGVLDDLFLAEYVDGTQVLQQLPVPIRAAQLRGEAVAPAPWTSATASGRPDSRGLVSMRATWKLPHSFALMLNLLRPATAGSVVMDNWQRHTRVGLWLAARRRGAPLDRFGVTFIDGLSYDIDTHYDQRTSHIRGNLSQAERDVNPALGQDPERERFAFDSEFRTLLNSDDMPDTRQARFDQPVASDIDLFRQFQRTIAPPSAASAGQMTVPEYIRTATTILDTLKLRTTEELEHGEPEREMPRLGFVFAPMDISIKVNPATGRMQPYFNASAADNPVQVVSPSLADVARLHLARALALRLHKRDFLGTGQAAILRNPPSNGVVSFHLAPKEAEPLLIDDPKIKAEMAQMWACSDVTQSPLEFIRPREFALAYGIDRDRQKVRAPEGTDFFEGTGDDEHLETVIDCSRIRKESYALGTVHTHPEDDGNSQHPSPEDSKKAATAFCGHQHYLISAERITLYRSDGTEQDLGSRQALLPKGAQCPQKIRPDGAEVE
ncbi:outer membrane protein OmpA-like peptidoglycan-associated protein/bacterioferritin-associated ferredoxin [Xanthomonas sp. JAI131]|uniref:eCIS core domain-containing protein n=1 Tax=Xanthomonas sp. JAI131 TaxID=2723067 RepID=UPI0015C6CEB0|nr:DUF4157 domain-containing protein [Xanthomonas sp. JAI131]NYF19449.1 outer membrane protein OmpA-like peptidoglycan-associated protein/bacterioferritin-associated ferredoxin [Xanthomonas sp. JAI131]